jgi:hypothetical protein
MFKHAAVRALTALALAVPAVAGLAVTTGTASAATVLADSQWGPTPPPGGAAPAPSGVDDSQWG